MLQERRIQLSNAGDWSIKMRTEPRPLDVAM